jgi:hypothetical protein
MNVADIAQIKLDIKNTANPVMTTMSKTDRGCFNDTTVTFGLQFSGRFGLWAEIDLFSQTVYNVDYYRYPQDMVIRWVNPNYELSFANELFERQEDPTVTSDGMQIRRCHDGDFLSGMIQGDIFMLEDEEEEEYETVELDLSDSELATIARAAHAKDMTINDFINEALVEELDRVMPNWREENRNGGL